MKKSVLIPIMGAALLGGSVAGVGLTAFAQSGSSSTATSSAPFWRGHAQEKDDGSEPNDSSEKGEMRGGFGGPAILGTVTAINGTTLSVTGKDSGLYTINAASTTVKKFASSTAPTTIALANVAVGDTVMVRGQIITASITAKEIMDGVPPARPQMGKQGFMGKLFGHGKGKGGGETNGDHKPN